MHAASEPTDSETAALKALSARIDPGLTANLLCEGTVLMVVNPDAPILSTVAVIASGKYAAQLGRGEPPVALAPVADPDAAAARVNRMLATVTP